MVTAAAFPTSRLLMFEDAKKVLAAEVVAV